MFATLRVYTNEADCPWFDGHTVIARLLKHGAPKDFGFDIFRHTLATWLQTQGRSEWHRGLVLNHSEHGVTPDYSHGSPLVLKLEMLTEWAEHIEQLVGHAS